MTWSRREASDHTPRTLLHESPNVAIWWSQWEGEWNVLADRLMWFDADALTAWLAGQALLAPTATDLQWVRE